MIERKYFLHKTSLVNKNLKKWSVFTKIFKYILIYSARIKCSYSRRRQWFLTHGLHSPDTLRKKFSWWFRHLFRIVGRKHGHTFLLAVTQNWCIPHTCFSSSNTGCSSNFWENLQSQTDCWSLMCQTASSSNLKLKSHFDKWADQIKLAKPMLKTEFWLWKLSIYTVIVNTDLYCFNKRGETTHRIYPY